MNSHRKIIHIDMDAFFASVEQLDNPDLRGKPVIVGGSPSGRGVVAACSYEARTFGIHSAMPCAKAIKLCPHALFTRPRMERYSEISFQLMNIFRQYTPLVEPLSLDEAFLDVTTNLRGEASASRLAEKIRRQIYQELRLTASAGVSFNKFLAKVASDQNKPDGLTVIPPSLALDFLDTLPIGKFFGVGKVTEKKMLLLGIKNGADLKSWQEEQLVKKFGKTGSFLHNIVRGVDPRPVQSRRIRKSIGAERTLATDSTDLVEIHCLLDSLADRVSAQLTKRKLVGHTLTLKVRYEDFSTITRSISVPLPISDYREITDLLPKLLQSTEAGHRAIRLLGLSVSKLDDAKRTVRQLRLPFTGSLYS